MKLNWKTELPLLVLIAGMFLAALLLSSNAPERFPVHWGMNGQVDRYGGRFEGLWLDPIMALALYGLLILLPRLDPGRRNYERFAGAYYTIRAAVIAMLAILYVVTQLSARGVPVDMPRFIGITIGGMIFVMGNVLGKLRPNWFFGVRTPWTLSSKRSWTKTHRLAGWIFVFGGIALMIAGAVRTDAAMITAFALFMAGVLVSVVYSYVVWRSDPDRVPPAGTSPSNGDPESEGIRPTR